MLKIYLNNFDARLLSKIIKANGRLIRLENRFIINSIGECFSLKTNIFKKPTVHHSGYLTYIFRVGEEKVHISVHQLVWQAFHGSIPKNKVINHKDANKQNNNLQNLELVTYKENFQHAKELGLTRTKEASKKVQCVETGTIFTSRTAAAKWLGLNPARVSHALAKNGKAGGYTWKNL